MRADPAPQQFRLGAATVTVITTGLARWVLATALRLPPGAPSEADRARLDALSPVPFHCMHVALGGASVAVDAMDYGLFRTSRGGPPLPPDRAVPRLDVQLASVGIRVEDITHVAITHGHDDHYNVATVPDETRGGRRLLFPRAIYVAQQADWTPEAQRAIIAALPTTDQLPNAAEEYLGLVFRQGRMRLVVGEHEIAPGISLIPAPGETPGHALVRVESDGHILYCLGDLFHDALEVEHPSWTPTWNDHEAALASRLALIDRALAENALLLASHITGVGRLRRIASGVATWEAVEIP